MILLQTPNPSTNILNYVLFSLVGLLVTAVGAMAFMLKTKANDSSPSYAHKTFADDPRAYWIEMKEGVTEPISKVLSEVVSVLKELRDQAIEERGARRERERLLDK